MIQKWIGRLSLIVATILTVGGMIGYGIVATEPDNSSALQSVQRKLQESDTRQERIESATYDEDVDFATGAEIAEARYHYEESVDRFGIGSIYIPSANIQVPLLAGTSEWNLFNGVATNSPDQKLGEDLFVGLSHNLINDTLLKRIDQVQPGDKVYATDFKDVYTYETLEQKVVHETDGTYFEMPDGDENAKMLLYRCEGRSGTNWRRSVYSELVSKESVEDTDKDILIGLNILEERIEQVSNNDSGNTSSTENRTDQASETVHTETILQRFIRWVSRNQTMKEFFLLIYQLADTNPYVFGAVVLGLFLLYGLL